MAIPGLKVDGVDLTRKGIAASGDRVLKSTLAGIRVEAKNIMSESQKQVPVDKDEVNQGEAPGFLKNSKFTRKVPNELAVMTGYAAFYALFVHDAPPDTQFDSGKRKFLEDPTMAAERGYPARLAARVKKATG